MIKLYYIPEIRAYCGSLLAAIIAQLMEMLFKENPEGFCRFIEPCAHALYKPGESLTEILNISAYAFRTNFSKIGVVYKSYSQYEEMISNKKDPFLGKPYLSYFIPKKNMTIYMRNNEVAQSNIGFIVDEVLRRNAMLEKAGNLI